MKHTNKNLTTLVLLVFFSGLAIANQPIEANQAFDSKDYTLAMQLYDQVIVE